MVNCAGEKKGRRKQVKTGRHADFRDFCNFANFVPSFSFLNLILGQSTVGLDPYEICKKLSREKTLLKQSDVQQMSD